MIAVLFALLEDSANCDDLAREAFSAACWALEDDALVAKLSETAAFADKLLFEEAVKLAFKAAALVEELVSVLESLWVALLADPPLAAVVVLPAVPTFEEVLPPLEALLLNVELPVDEAVEPVVGKVAAEFAVEPEADVSLLACALFAVTPSVAPSDLVELFVRDPFAAKAFVVALDLLELEDSEAASDAVRLLLALACCMLLLVLVKLSDEVWFLDSLSVDVLASVVEWFSEVLRLEEKLLLLVVFELLSTVSWLFFPRW